MAETTGRVLIVDDDEGIRDLLADMMREEGYEPLTAKDGQEAVEMVTKTQPDVVLLDIVMPGLDGFAVLRRVKEIDRDLPVVMVTALDRAREAVNALRAGAEDFLTKPFTESEVFRAVHGAITQRMLRRKIRVLSDRMGEVSSLPESMGPSEPISRLTDHVRRVADSNFTVLVTGETGTGKELVARAIHGASPRRDSEFVAVDCGAIPETLFESELFGHEKGSFTGAYRRKPGRFEVASGGTLFLDEISNMPPGSQAKLLRAIQERRITRVGGTGTIDVDVRLLAASNQDLSDSVSDGRFRRDLYYRLNEFHIQIPPLRDRREDILFLAKRFLDLTNHELAKTVAGFTDASVEWLMGYDWPGNVRELRSLIRRAVLLADRDIEVRHLGDLRGELAASPVDLGDVFPEGGETVPLKELVRRATEAVERVALSRILEATHGNKAEAARRLRIDYKTMHVKLKRYGIAIPSS